MTKGNELETLLRATSTAVVEAIVRGLDPEQARAMGIRVFSMTAASVGLSGYSLMAGEMVAKAVIAGKKKIGDHSC